MRTLEARSAIIFRMKESPKKLIYDWEKIKTNYEKGMPDAKKIIEEFLNQNTAWQISLGWGGFNSSSYPVMPATAHR